MTGEDRPDEQRDEERDVAGVSLPLGDIDARVEEMLAAEALPEELAVRVSEQEPADAADTIERLAREEQAEVVHLMAVEAAADALAHMELPLATTVLLDLEPLEASQLLEQMDPDDAADLLQELPRDKRQPILRMLPPRRAAILGKLALYDPETAGGLMTTQIGVVRAASTIGQAIEALKRHELGDQQTEVYCVDDEKRLVGTIGLRDLLVLDNAKRVEDHMERDVDSVHPEVDREEVARIFQRYDLITLPVVDEEGRALGMITIDDVVDIIAAEATEDAYKQVGAGEGEAVYSTVGEKFKGRFPWLLGNLLMAQAGAIVLLAYHDLIAAIPVVAIVYPLIANQSGNAGNQSMAVALRGLVLGEVRRERVIPLFVREALFGAIAGFVIGAVFGAGLGVVGPVFLADSPVHIQWQWLALVAGVAMMGALTVGCVVGTGVPILLRRLGRDPATGSSILVTMTTDASSYATFLTLVLLLRGLLTG